MRSHHLTRSQKSNKSLKEDDEELGWAPVFGRWLDMYTLGINNPLLNSCRSTHASSHSLCRTHSTTENGSTRAPKTMSAHRPKLSTHPNSSLSSFTVLVDVNNQHQTHIFVPGRALLTKRRDHYLGTASHKSIRTRIL